MLVLQVLGVQAPLVITAPVESMVMILPSLLSSKIGGVEPKAAPANTDAAVNRSHGILELFICRDFLTLTV